jgi:hypothetical protein
MLYFDHHSIPPTFPTKYIHGTIRNGGNGDSVSDVSCGGGRVRPRSQTALCSKKLVSGFSQLHRPLSVKSLGKHKVGEIPPSRFCKMNPISRL